MGHSHLPYPKSLPLECVTGLLSQLRGGPTSIAANRSLVVKHLWSIGSYGLYMTFGEPNEEQLMGAAAVDQKENALEQLAELETLLLEHEEQIVNYGDTNTAEAINLVTVAQLVSMVLSLIKQLRGK